MLVYYFAHFAVSCAKCNIWATCAVGKPLSNSRLNLYVLHHAALAAVLVVKLYCIPTSHKNAAGCISTCDSAAQTCLLAGYLTLECTGLHVKPSHQIMPCHSPGQQMRSTVLVFSTFSQRSQSVTLVRQFCIQVEQCF